MTKNKVLAGQNKHLVNYANKFAKNTVKMIQCLLIDSDKVALLTAQQNWKMRRGNIFRGNDERQKYKIIKT